MESIFGFTVSRRSTDSGIYLELADERGPVVLVYCCDAYMQVIVANAAHRVWRGAGRLFRGAARWDDARASYRSSRMVRALAVAESCAS